MAGMEPGKKSRRARRHFTEEFRAGAVRLVLDEGHTVGRVARDLDLTVSALRAWRARHPHAMSPHRWRLAHAQRTDIGIRLVTDV